MMVLQRQAIDSFIRAYADEKTLEAYNNATKEQQRLVQGYAGKAIERNRMLAEQNMVAKNGWNSFWDTSDNGF